MKVTVIVPNFNHESFLQKRIDSILAQTFDDYELILLDDCSKDNSVQIIEGYRNNPKVSQIILNQSNSGSVFRQWEKGIGMARGEYIWIAESDDYAEPNFLSTLVPILDAEPRVGFVYTDSYCHRITDTNPDNAVRYSKLRNDLLSTNKWSRSYQNNGRQEIKESLIGQCTVNNGSAVLFRRSALQAVKPFDVSFRYLGDWYCYLKICLNYDISYLHEPLNHYRDHPNNASKNLEQQLTKMEEYFKIYNWAIRQAPFVDRNVIMDRFKFETFHSLHYNWSWQRIRLYSRLFMINPYLFFTMFERNIYYIKKRFHLN